MPETHVKALASIGLGLSFLFAQASGHAQVYPCNGAGPGEQIVGMTQGGNGLAPVPLCQRIDAPAQRRRDTRYRWESRWGAIAADVERGILGTSSTVAKERDAVAQAVANCKAKGGIDCQPQWIYADQCVAMAVGTTALGFGTDVTLLGASKAAIDNCSTQSDACAVHYSDCSPPALVR